MIKKKNDDNVDYQLRRPQPTSQHDFAENKQCTKFKHFLYHVHSLCHQS